MSKTSDGLEASVTPGIQNELVQDYSVLTGHVSLQVIQMLNLQDLETSQFIERLERQHQDLVVAKAASVDAQPDELLRVARQQYKLEATKKAIMTFESSASILAGSILQIVQQGMSRVHSSIWTYPHKGRTIHGVSLCDLVWQGRNQAMHYETTAKRADWSAVFANLNVAMPSAFSIAPPYVSRAKSIFDLLGWGSYSVYERDVKSLLLGCRDSEEQPQ